MNEALRSLLQRYTPRSADEYENALKEIIQEIALLGLWRAKFFEKAAFYGGSALRILYGLDRFSEDLDFSLLAHSPRFEMPKYCGAIEDELRAFGFAAVVEGKAKSRQSAIESAFIKAGTIENMIRIDVPTEILNRLQRSARLKIKFEVDTAPPQHFQTEVKYVLQPIPFAVKTYSLASLFAGKMHALLFRQWKNRVKGRDWYDLVWYVGRDVPVNRRHLCERMRQTGHLGASERLSDRALKAMIQKKIAMTDLEQAKTDVLPMLRDPEAIAVWSKDFFLNVCRRIRTIEEE